jgi:hypothetical protein
MDSRSLPPSNVLVVSADDVHEERIAIQDPDQAGRRHW